ncbi:MAG: DUF642 domain-containing protein [Fimbriimonadaceae bacterium]|nr:DUF642 domain-containing protein [Fimbriimonadaceae bacterium]
MPSTLFIRTSLLFTISIIASLASASLVQNGSLEEGEIPSPGTVISISPGSSRIAGWTISTQELAWWNGNGYGVEPADGQCHLDLFGFHDHFPSAVISQSIATVPGADYRVSFDVGRYNANSQIRVRAGSEFADFASDGIGISWKTATWVFTATSTSTLLSFEAGPQSATIHAGLDNVVVTRESIPRYFPGTEHWYECVYIPDGVYWEEARQLADIRGGYLACIGSESENDFAYSLVETRTFSDSSVFGDRIGPWLGGFHESNGAWQWISGEPFTFSYWYPSQPDYYGGGRQRNAYYRYTVVDSSWVDHPGGPLAGFYAPRGYVVEFDNPPVIGQIELSGYLPDEAGEVITIEQLQGGTVIGTKLVTLQPGGHFSFTSQVTGPTSLRAKGNTFLAKTVAVTNLGNGLVTLSSAILTNGDCDGDNEVGIADYAILSYAYGSSVGDGNWAENADLNGDETVDIADYAILSANYGEVGD